MILDLLFAAVVLAVVVLVGLRNQKSAIGPSERFTAKRQLSWLTLGASLAASSMSADTPLLIAGAVYMDGLPGNWFWWAGAPGVLATLFFFARLWRRSGVITEIEIFRLRYGTGTAARRYRIFQAFLEGVVLNVLVLASNGYAFSLIIGAMLKRWQLDAYPTLAPWLTVACFVGAAAYALLVGFRGLVKSDAAEFFISLAAGAVLAIVAIAGLPAGLASLHGLHTARAGASIFATWPVHDPLAPLLLLTLGWWQSAPGRNMLVQRVVASRDERSATLMVGTFIVFHFLIRPWGWYLIGAAALFYLPAHSNPDQALPALAGALLPHGLFGIIMAVTALAFIGCVNSRLNFGASYLVNDVALALRPSLSSRWTRHIETNAIIVLTLAAMVLALNGVPSSIRALYQFLTMMMAGTGFVAIARWYWWRTSILCEIASLLSSAIVACVTLLISDISQPAVFAAAVAINFVTGLTVTIIAAHLGPPTVEPLLRSFFEKIMPGGPGWRRFGISTTDHLPALTASWAIACLALFAAIFAGTRLLAGDRLQALLAGCLVIVAVAALVWLAGKAKTSIASA
ncbi:MAG: hypothetical protein ABIV36_04320 [Sphingobium limneticum]